MKTGLRDVRFVIFDNGRRMLFATAFETDWNNYIDDAVPDRWHAVLPGMDSNTSKRASASTTGWRSAGIRSST